MNEQIKDILTDMIIALAEEKGVKLYEGWSETEGFYTWVDFSRDQLAKNAQEIFEHLVEETLFER